MIEFVHWITIKRHTSIAPCGWSSSSQNTSHYAESLMGGDFCSDLKDKLNPVINKMQIQSYHFFYGIYLASHSVKLSSVLLHIAPVLASPTFHYPFPPWKVTVLTYLKYSLPHW